ncbi:hypothetical protein NPIL_209841 [Nephila pilipes]|uniref:Uncharacterized protein n=1 Tax=Nephila pilipes TaxID=299642 RepID=A0A8X6TV66_NEPPI|nr:hypothetical protein NPIL_209841 [Nephila pilipes]
MFWQKKHILKASVSNLELRFILLHTLKSPHYAASALQHSLTKHPRKAKVRQTIGTNKHIPWLPTTPSGRRKWRIWLDLSDTTKHLSPWWLKW